MINPELLDTILLEWSYRLKDGIPDVNDSEKVKILNEVLIEFNLPTLESLLLEDKTAEESEGMTIYFSGLTADQLKLVDESLISKKPKIKLPTTGLLVPIDITYYGNAATPVKDLIKKFNTSKQLDEKIISRFANSVSMAKYIHSTINTSGNVICDRGTFFKTVKDRAHDIGKTADIGDLRSDKWCPADIFIYAGGGPPDLSESDINEITFINVNVEDSTCLNELFVESFTPPPSKKILGISLKEALAQGGKAKSFTSTLERKDFPPDVAKLTDEQNFAKNISFYLDFVLNKFDSNNDSDRASTFLYAAAARDEINKSKKASAALNKIAIDLESYINTNLGKSNISGKQAKDLYKQNPKKIKVPNTLASNVQTYYESALDDAYDFYISARENLFAELESTGNYDLDSRTTPIAKSDVQVPPLEKDDAPTIQSLLKKGGCYQVAQELILGLSLEEFGIPELYSNISKDTNAFVALTAFAIGYAGISPTFFKLNGTRSVPGIGKKEKFEGSGILTLPEDSVITIIDTPTYKGFRAVFTVDVNVDGKTEKTYEISLTFRYSEITISIESAAPKEK
jgi:hypothetical protein